MSKEVNISRVVVDEKWEREGARFASAFSVPSEAVVYWVDDVRDHPGEACCIEVYDRVIRTHRLCRDTRGVKEVLPGLYLCTNHHPLLSSGPDWLIEVLAHAQVRADELSAMPSTPKSSSADAVDVVCRLLESGSVGAPHEPSRYEHRIREAINKRVSRHEKWLSEQESEERRLERAIRAFIENHGRAPETIDEVDYK